MAEAPSRFVWHELVTSQPEAAARFYSDVVGWNPVKFAGGGDYTVLEISPGRGTAGVMAPPPDASGMPPMWLGYLYAEDADAKALDIAAAGGSVKKGPQEIPGIGRFAVCTDPHGTPFMIMRPYGENPPPLAMETPGTIGWNDLSADNLDEAWSFYSGLFGWTKGDVFPMEGMGDYVLFHAGDEYPIGGMMTKPPYRAEPMWLFYFVVPALDAAVDRLVKAGGKVTMEPMEVPGGAWAMEAVDPQGARFGLTAAHR